MERILYLGESALFNWEALMIRENAISHYYKEFSENREVIVLPNYRISDKKLLYFFMVLFDKIGSVIKSSYDLSCLNNLGLIDMESLSWSIQISKSGTKEQKPNLLFSPEKVNYYENVAKDLMNKNKDSIIRFLEIESNHYLASRLDQNDHVFIDHFDTLAAYKFFSYWVQEPDIIEVGELYTPTVIKSIRTSISRGL